MGPFLVLNIRPHSHFSVSDTLDYPPGELFPFEATQFKREKPWERDCPPSPPMGNKESNGKTWLRMVKKKNGKKRSMVKSKTKNTNIPEYLNGV